MELVLEKVPLLLLSGAFSAAAYMAEHTAGAVGSLQSFSWALRLFNAVVSYGVYAVKTVLPTDLAVMYPLHLPELWEVGLALAFLLVATRAAVRLRRRQPALIVGWLWYLGTLVPVIGLVQVGNHAWADRFSYVPLTGVFLMAASGGAELARRVGLGRRTVAALCLAALLGFALITRHQMGFWRTPMRMVEHTQAVTGPNAFIAQVEAKLQTLRGNRRGAMQAYARTMAAEPYYLPPYLNMGAMLRAQGHPLVAAQLYRLALELAAEDARVWNNLGMALADLGRREEAVHALQRAVELAPEHEQIRQNLERVREGG
jgi:tetratricopeptide (TPR) repeat protein